MTLLICSTLAGFVAYQILSAIQPAPMPGGPDPRTIAIGQLLQIVLPEATYVKLKAAVTAILAVFLVVMFSVYASYRLHPAEGYVPGALDLLRSSSVPPLLFGLVSGLILGSLTNRVVLGARDYQLAARDYLELFLFTLLLVLGIGGEETIRRITKVSIGATTEISFSEQPSVLRASSDQVSNASQPAGSGDGTAGFLKSQGIANLNALGEIIGRDLDYVNLLNTENDDDGFDRTVKAISTYQRRTAAIFSTISCLSKFASRTGDTAMLRSHLSPFLEDLRPWRAKETEFAAHFTELRSWLSGEVKMMIAVPPKFGNSTDEADLSDACGKVIHPICAERSSNGQCASPDVTTDTRNVAATPFAGEAPPSVPLPYTTMAYADLAAHFGDYQSGAAALHEWLIRAESAKSKSQWMIIRGRFALGSHLEEWIRNEGLKAAPTLRAYHIANLRKIVAWYTASKTLQAIAKATGELTLDATKGWPIAYSGDTGVCNLVNHENPKIAGQFLESYISALSLVVHHSLAHPIISRAQVGRTTSFVQQMVRLALRCVPQSEVLRAETFERDGRNEINLANLNLDAGIKDDAKQHLETALRLFRRGLEIVDGAHRAEDREQTSNRAPFAKRIETGTATEVFQSLSAGVEAARQALRQVEH